MTEKRATCTISRPPACRMHKDLVPHSCKRMAAADRAAAKKGGPGYPWRLYSDPKAGEPKARSTGSLRTPRWAHEDPLTAWKRHLASPFNPAETRLYEAYVREWEDGTHPWAGTSRPEVVAEPEDDGPWPSYHEVTA